MASPSAPMLKLQHRRERLPPCCTPPLFGGRRIHPLLLSIAHALHRKRVTTARSDFRHASGNTIEEMPDAIACCHELQRRHRDLPLVIVGYSFGSIVAARIASVVGAQHLIMIAPPLSTVSLDIPATSTTLIIAEHDQFSPPATISDNPIVKEAGMSIVAGADHFLNGHIKHRDRTHRGRSYHCPR